MTHEQFITLTTAKMLKQAGFDWECRAYCYYLENDPDPDLQFYHTKDFINFNNWGEAIFSVPTQAVAMRWLREVKGWYVIISPQKNMRDWDVIYRPAIFEEKAVIRIDFPFSTYEQAAEIGIQGCLKVILNEQEQ